jgi:hypothetical protein
VRNRWSMFKSVFWLFVITLVVLYPMLISIYVFLPLFIGFAGLLIIRGIEGKGYKYILIPLVYLVNLEINLSLPLLLILFSVLLYYLTLYGQVMYLKRCKICVSVLSVVIIDIYYMASLLGYDFIMDSHSLVIDKLLWYSLGADIVMAVL